METSTSPVLQRDQRRRTTTIVSEPIASPQKSARRTKTTNLKTYGSSHRTFEATDDAAFAALRDDAEGIKTSQSARLTGHSSGPNGSSGLPAGTIQEDFINHEPNFMFKDTGSTNAFNESSQQRLVEQALNNGESVTAMAEENTTASAEKQSSSFPWSASADATQSQKTKQSDALRQDAPEPHAADDTIAVATKQTSGSSSVKSAKNTVDTSIQGVLKNHDDTQQTSSKARPPKSSPVVEIPRYHPFPEDDDDEPPKASRGRKRKSQDDVEDTLNSDDRAIGLPKENYKPRPSRRRATVAVEEPIDYSVVPGKTSRKRRKTAEGKIGGADNLLIEDTQTQKEAAKERSQLADSTASKVDIQESYGASANETNDEAKQPEKAPTESGPTPHKGSQQSDASSKQEQASAQKATDAMLMKPPPLPASASKKSRRSKTTIFEDHVELNRGQKSPSLSQQQASRKTALAEMSNHSKPNRRQKRRTIVQDDDEDDEDELAKDMSEEEEEAAPKKRGRPAKPMPKPEQQNTKSKEKVLSDSEADEDELELEDEEPPKKKKGGRPAKAKADEASKPKEATEPAQHTPSKQPTEPSSETIGQSSPSKAALARKDANAKAPPNAAKETPAASPEKPAQPPSKEASSSEKTPAKPSPTTHSPIKGSSFANYRVGLSKRSRIPSLLKSFRAPAPARR